MFKKKKTEAAKEPFRFADDLGILSIKCDICGLRTDHYFNGPYIEFNFKFGHKAITFHLECTKCGLYTEFIEEGAYLPKDHTVEQAAIYEVMYEPDSDGIIPKEIIH